MGTSIGGNASYQSPGAPCTFLHILKSGLEILAYSPVHARSRLNSFGTLDLKIVGKKIIRYRCVPKMASPEARKK